MDATKTVKDIGRPLRDFNCLSKQVLMGVVGPVAHAYNASDVGTRFAAAMHAGGACWVYAGGARWLCVPEGR